MADLAKVNLSDFSDLQQTMYDDMAATQLREGVKWDFAVSRRFTKHLTQGNSFAFTLWSGADATASARGKSDLTADTPSDTQVPITAGQYTQHDTIDDSAEMGGIQSIAESFMLDRVGWLAEEHDLLASTAAVAGTNVIYVGQTARASITASDTLTAAYVRRAFAWLSSQKAPKFMTPAGMVYAAYVAPFVAHDLKEESNGLFAGPTNVNAPNLGLNELGIAGGFVFFETNSSAMLNADAGSGSVDVYYNVFLGDQALGKVTYPISPVDGAVDIVAGENRSAIVRYTRPLSNAGLKHDVTAIMNAGFDTVREECIYRVESASSIGANT